MCSRSTSGYSDTEARHLAAGLFRSFQISTAGRTESGSEREPLFRKGKTLTNVDAISGRSSSDKRHWFVSLLLLGGLLFLRFPYLIVVRWGVTDTTLSGADLVFIEGTSLLTAVLIWWEREHLREFWIDLASAITFLCQMLCLPIGIGLIAWQARSIFAGMVTHGVFNACGDMLAHTRSLAEALRVGWIVLAVLAVALATVWFRGWAARRRILSRD